MLSGRTTHETILAIHFEYREICFQKYKIGYIVNKQLKARFKKTLLNIV